MPASTAQRLQTLRTGAAAVSHAVAYAARADDVTVLVAAALFSPNAGALMTQAAAAASTPSQRQLLAVAAAHLAGDADLVDALAREHLAYHPDSVLVACISALRPSPVSTAKESP
jgi:hypothetical protein